MTVCTDAFSLLEKKNTLMAHLARFQRVGVALSGGCDSSLVLSFCCRVLGKENVIAVTAATSLQFACDAETAAQVAAFCGVTHIVVDTAPLDAPEITANPPERCYLCKKKSYTKFYELLSAHGTAVLLDGTNRDDLSEDRPGLRALAELAVVTPLAAVGIVKNEARLLAREIGLANWNRPSASCLATRIPWNTCITPERLERVREIEEFLMSRGFIGCRARLADDTAIILELPRTDIERFIGTARLDFLSHCADLGVKKIFFDLAGR